MKKLNLLLVDDEEEVREVLSEIFEDYFGTVTTASNGNEALDIFQKKPIDFVITDVDMPIMDGLDLVKNIRKENRDIHILVISGNTESRYFVEFIKLKINGYILKPIMIEQVLNDIETILEDATLKIELKENKKTLQEYKDTVDENSIVSKANLEGKITYVNDKFCELSGFSRDELIGKNHNIVRHPDTPKEVFENMWHTIKDLKKPWNGKIKNRKKDGGYYWVEACVKPILDLNNNIVEFIGLRNDITEFEDTKKYLNDSVKSSNYMLHQFQDAVENSSAIARVDLDFNITYVNDKYTTLSRYSYAEMMGRNIIDFVDNESLHLVPQILETIKKGKVYKGVFKGVKKNAEPYYTKSTIKPLKEISGEIIEYLVLKTDITQEMTLHEEIENTQKEIIYTMGAIGESRSKETGEHVKRVAEYSYLLAKLLGLDEQDAQRLKMASPMHDIGKVGIPDEVLNKPGKLTQEEFEVMKSHSLLGYEMLKGSTRKTLQASATIAHEHHERWDGTGYPRGLKGEDIHIYARITSIADVFDALGHDRCYKKAWELEDIYALLEESKGKHFDPKLVELFLDNKADFIKIRDFYND